MASSQTARTDLNATTHYYYDFTFALNKITNPLGQSLQITLNTAGGRPQTVVDANGVTTQLSYDERQRLKARAMSTTAGTLTTTFQYDPAGNLITTTLPDGSSLPNSYDDAHRLTGVTDAIGSYTKYTLDGLAIALRQGSTKATALRLGKDRAALTRWGENSFTRRVRDKPPRGPMMRTATPSPSKTAWITRRQTLTMP